MLRPGGRLGCAEPDHGMSAVDADNQDAGDRCFRARFAHLRHPRIGRRLPTLLADAGLVDIDVHVTGIPVRSWSRFTGRLADRDALAHAVSIGEVTQEEADAFVADMETRDANGRFFATLIAFNVTGTKPPSGPPNS